MKRYYLNILFVLFVILAPLIVACESSDEGGQDLPDNTTYEVICNIDTRAVGDNPGTDAEQAERMHSLLLYVVNKADSKIEAIIDQTFNEGDDRTDYKEIVELTEGKKIIYGFANLTSAMRTTAGLDGLQKSNQLPADGIGNALCRTDLRSGNYIPMSNSREITVNKLPGQSYKIDLIRLMCKITINVTNAAGYPITMQSIETAPFTSLDAPVYLLPHQQEGVCRLPEGTEIKTIEWNWPDAGKELPDEGDRATYTLYANESAVANDGWFTFQLNTIKNGEMKTDRFSISNTQRLNRNDYLPVNITLTDYKLRLEVLSYPPIGGYPSVEVPMQDKEYYAYFPGGGPFIITPKLSKYSTGEEVTEDYVTWKMTVTGSTEIFDVQPALKNGEIIGTLNNAPQIGKKALCTLTGEVQEPGMTVARILSYKVYIMNYR